jgi:hypothetical protein
VSTPRLGLPDPPDGATDEIAEGDDYLQALSGALDAKLAPVEWGPFANRPAATIAGRRYFATDKLTEFVATGSTWIPTTAPRVVTALPSSPFDGEEVLFQDAAMDGSRVRWHLRYEAGAGAYDWEYLGGGWLWTQPTPPVPGVQIGGSAITSGPTGFNVPIAGYYEVCARGLATNQGDPDTTYPLNFGVQQNGGGPLVGAGAFLGGQEYAFSGIHPRVLLAAGANLRLWFTAPGTSLLWEIEDLYLGIRPWLVG